MNLDSDFSSLQQMSDEELQEFLRVIRSRRRQTKNPEQARKRTTRKKPIKIDPSTLSADSAKELLALLGVE